MKGWLVPTLLALVCAVCAIAGVLLLTISASQPRMEYFGAGLSLTAVGLVGLIWCAVCNETGKL